ncbi:hypothetical protein HHY41_004576 [Salmonella enterica]|nr:hypothetical protein [Salmonella enterica]EBR8222785.1 hypothetical protein [Salmonella enterica subsp. enterica serovar Oranienburg]ECB6427859.1 hypothetical protein [Salmonella enterica subsp. enterica serovar Adelaide]EDG3842356.1 hypothetical protein [Salmonella enterica subsp. enterica serovar Rissen]EAY0959648.1 hypothetical protein [Salmonella enterica]
MATKEDRIKFLRKLGEKLGRDVDTTGTVAEIEQRIKELKEELAAADEQDEQGEEVVARGREDVAETDDQEAQEDVQIKPREEAQKKVPGVGLPREGLVKVRAIRTLHLRALDGETDREVEMVEPGDVVRVTTGVMNELIDNDLAVRV